MVTATVRVADFKFAEIHAVRLLTWMQPMKLKLEWHFPGAVAITLLLAMAHSTGHTQPAQSTTSPATVVVGTSTLPTPENMGNEATESQAATAARRDTDPKLNGSIGDAPPKPSAK